MSKKSSRARLSHIDTAGNARMVDVTDKDKTYREAVAEGFVRTRPETVAAIAGGDIPKGNVFTTAKIAGIQAAKQTADLIPLCHPLSLSWIEIEFKPGEDRIHIRAVVKTTEATGVEMEALTAVSVAALTIYDMCKAVDKDMTIEDIRLVEKKGGKSNLLITYRPRAGVMVVSDSVYEGKREDTSGKILKEGFSNAGCRVDHYVVLPDGSNELRSLIADWVDDGVELILTSGGTGLGPRDLSVSIIEELFDSRLPGVEQVLHAYGRTQASTAMLSRLAAGTVDASIVICLPGSPAAAKDALKVLIPSIFHAFPIMKGEGHVTR